MALGLTNDDIYDSKLVSPAQAEKKLKALKLPMPTDVVAVVSSGSTMAHSSRPLGWPVAQMQTLPPAWRSPCVVPASRGFRFVVN